MWPELRYLRHFAPSIDSVDLLMEILVRLILLLVTCTLQLSIKPHMPNIDETDLLKTYNHPRRESIVPPWVIVFIVFIPSLFFAIPFCFTKNSVDLTQSFLAWTLALSINALMTETIKLATGRPRPDYFYRCFPDGVITNEFKYTGDLKDIWEGRKSFPSGHSSFAFCSMGFLSLWMCGRLDVVSRRRRFAVGVVTCTVPLLVAMAVAVSRCFDNHHHWEDVLAGSLLGVSSSYLCYSRYYHPLSSDMAGCPYIINERSAGDNVSQSACGSSYSLE